MIEARSINAMSARVRSIPSENGMRSRTTHHGMLAEKCGNSGSMTMSDELESHKRRLDRENSRFINKIKELKEELEREHKQVHDMCEQLALLTRCTKEKPCIVSCDFNYKCQGCRNSALLKDKEIYCLKNWQESDRISMERMNKELQAKDAEISDLRQKLSENDSC